MAKVDMHVHSKYSNHPSEWFLQRIGASECYTEPETVYATARKRGMDFVTITDHNSIEGALRLADAHPLDTFVSVEATAYFPEDDCKVHVLCYDIAPRQFNEIQRARTDIYQLRAFLLDEGIAHSIAHGTYSVNDRLTVGHLEKLILLFNVFEACNGSRAKLNNEPWSAILHALTHGHIEAMRARYAIDPVGDMPWRKGFTGGSDDHSGMFIARAHTHGEGITPAEFIENVRARRTVAEGNYSGFQDLAFSIYKIAYDFSKRKSDTLSRSLMSRINESLFETRKRSLRSRITFASYRLLKGGASRKGVIEEHYRTLYEALTEQTGLPVEERLDMVYDKLGDISDELFRLLVTSFERDLRRGDIPGILKNAASSLTGIFLTVPFMSTLRHFFLGRGMTGELAARLGMHTRRGTKKILWFTDTFTQMNGVAKTVRKIAWLSYLKDRDITIVTSVPAHELGPNMPPNILNLPHLHEFGLPHYDHYKLRIPSLLRSLRAVADFEPDEVWVSTPGPLGLFGLMASRLLNATSVGVYHTDFTLQAHELIEDGALESLVESYLKWFYALCDDIRVPTHEYMDILAERGYDRSKMKLFRRGVDAVRFHPRDTGREYLAAKYGVRDGFTLMYAGRLSQDKNIGLLMEVYSVLARERTDINLVVAGEGPDLDALKRKYAANYRVVFTGAVDHDTLPELYSGADLFVFPSTTDTFGMAVLEAQACGLPAIVSGTGGPREIVLDGITGWVAQDMRPGTWIGAIRTIMTEAAAKPERSRAMRVRSRDEAVRRFDWDAVLDDYTLEQDAPEHAEIFPAQAPLAAVV